MAIEAVAAIAAKEVAVQAAKEAALQAGREIAQKMATDSGVQNAGSELQNAMMEHQVMQDGFRIGEMPETKGEGAEFAKQRESTAAEELRGKLEADETQPEAAENIEAPDETNPEMERPDEMSETTNVESLRDTIRKETGWSDEIVNSIRNEGEYGVYKNADLTEGNVNGHPCLQREIDPSFKDDFGRTNLERMQHGLSPYDAKSGEKLELHHMGQRSDSPFAELRENLDHGDGNHGVLHEMKTESWRREPGSVANYSMQRTDYWKTRATLLVA